MRPFPTALSFILGIACLVALVTQFSQPTRVSQAVKAAPDPTTKAHA